MPRFNHRLDMVSVPLTVGSKDGTSLRNPVNRNAPCQPVRSLARNNELSCTKAGEQEFSYCVAKTLNSNRLDYYYSTIFVTTWPGSVNGNTLHDANNETRFGNNVTREYGVTVDADCRYEVTQNGAFAARDAKKDSINRQGAASRVPVNNTQTTLAP